MADELNQRGHHGVPALCSRVGIERFRDLASGSPHHGDGEQLDWNQERAGLGRLDDQEIKEEPIGVLGELLRGVAAVEIGGRVGDGVAGDQNWPARRG
ncbi:hypothetical protein [Bradyrhizobium sp. F1.13.3]|uniref:hypothetical protein n=1 Tax=Bradyrhizobium sp. F1.13.3 TaxID=3156351 RepID=UPI003391EAB2